jgi:lamin B
MEISAYRKLLESEEQRLNISTSMVGSNLHNSYLNESSMHAAASSTNRGNKKRRLAQSGDEEQQQAVSSLVEPIFTYTQSSESKNGIDIDVHDFDSHSVTLTNTTENDIPIGNWTIRRLADGNNVDYKFPKSTVIKANAQIVIWSSTAPNAKNEPPNSLISKNQWTVGDKMITVLSDKEGNEQSRRESQKEIKPHIEKRQRTSTSSTLEVHTNGEAKPKSTVSKLFGGFFSSKN